MHSCFSNNTWLPNTPSSQRLPATPGNLPTLTISLRLATWSLTGISWVTPSGKPLRSGRLYAPRPAQDPFVATSDASVAVLRRRRAAAWFNRQSRGGSRGGDETEHSAPLPGTSGDAPSGCSLRQAPSPAPGGHSPAIFAAMTRSSRSGLDAITHPLRHLRVRRYVIRSRRSADRSRAPRASERLVGNDNRGRGSHGRLPLQRMAQPAGVSATPTMKRAPRSQCQAARIR